MVRGGQSAATVAVQDVACSERRTIIPKKANQACFSPLRRRRCGTRLFRLPLPIISVAAAANPATMSSSPGVAPFLPGFVSNRTKAAPRPQSLSSSGGIVFEKLKPDAEPVDYTKHIVDRGLKAREIPTKDRELLLTTKRVTAAATRPVAPYIPVEVELDRQVGRRVSFDAVAGSRVEPSALSRRCAVGLSPLRVCRRGRLHRVLRSSVDFRRWCARCGGRGEACVRVCHAACAWVVRVGEVHIWELVRRPGTGVRTGALCVSPALCRCCCSMPFSKKLCMKAASRSRACARWTSCCIWWYVQPGQEW